ncbi:MAG: 6,7-dimethyl-8-ribityllumazine synthase [Cypionkella sp.]
MTHANDTLPMPVFDKPVKLLIVVAAQHRAMSQAMLAAAEAALGQIEREVIWMPTVLELAPAIALAERMARFDGYVALGAVLRDEAQADILTREPAAAITLLGLQGAAVGNGVLLAEDSAQATEFGAMKGAEAAAAALHLIALSRKWATDTKGIGFRQ